MLLATSISVLVFSSCSTPGSEYSYEQLDYYKSTEEVRSERNDEGPAYNDDDFYYFDGRAYPNNDYLGHVSYTVGYSYYHGSSICPICHHNPCSGHGGHSSEWSRSSGKSHIHRDTNDLHVSGGKSQKDRDDHHSGSLSTVGNDVKSLQRGSGAASFTQRSSSMEPSYSRNRSSSSSTGSSGHGGSSSKKDKDDDDDKKKR